MQQYLLSIYQPDGDPPPPETLEPIMAEMALAEEMKAAGAWVFNGGPMADEADRCAPPVG